MMRYVFTLIMGLIIVWLMGVMFEQNLWMIFGKDAPFGLDMLGGMVLNGLNLMIWVGCLVVRAMGFPEPFYPLS